MLFWVAAYPHGRLRTWDNDRIRYRCRLPTDPWLISRLEEAGFREHAADIRRQGFNWESTRVKVARKP